MSCFREGNKFLPAPPVNVHVHTLFSDNHISIEWQDATKNQDTTHWYWVYWKKVGTNEMDRDRVESNGYELTSLEPDSTYEFVVKTSNYHGTSILSEPLVINLSQLRKESLTSENQMLTNVFLTLFFILFASGSVVLVAFIVYRNNFLSKLGSPFGSSSCNDNIGVSFENHAYSLEDNLQMSEQNLSNDQTSATTITATTTNNNNNNGNTHRTNGFNNISNTESNMFNSDQNNNPNRNGQPRVQIRLS